MRGTWLKWLPAAAMPAVVAAVVIAGPLQAAPTTALPDKTPAQLIAMVAASHVTAFSGTVEQGAELGLPELPATGTSGAAAGSSGIGQIMEALAQDHVARVYADGPTKQRLQVLDVMAERDVIRNGNTIWAYDSDANTATRITVPEHNAGAAGVPASPVLSPAEMATRLLNGLDPSTELAVGRDTSIANRAAYDLELTPRTHAGIQATLIGTISVAVDAQTGLPLSVALYPQGSGTAAFQVSFTQLDLKAPAASVFAFTPPAGTTVNEPVPTKPAPTDHSPHAKKPQFKSTGTGWSTIAETPAGTVPPAELSNPALQQLLHQVDGGQALETSLFSVLVTSDGRVLSGAVPVAALQAAAAGK